MQRLHKKIFTKESFAIPRIFSSKYLLRSQALKIHIPLPIFVSSVYESKVIYTERIIMLMLHVSNEVAFQCEFLLICFDFTRCSQVFDEMLLS
jgi:hypothetical protein